MRRKRFLIALITVICLTASCGTQGGASKKDPAPASTSEADPAQTAAAEAGTAQEAAAEAGAARASSSQEAAEIASPENTVSAESAVPGMYEDERGWYVHYEPELFTVEKGTDDVKFLYTGEAVGDNYVEIRYLTGVQPKEALTAELEELTQEWELEEDAIVQDEGYLFDDSWCYTATAEVPEDERDSTLVYQSAEYGDGVILTKLVCGMTDENILEGFMDDALWQIVESLTFYSYPPQKEYDYVPGIYTCAVPVPDAPEQIILKKNHTGSLVSGDTIPVFWGSSLLTEKRSENTREYTVEGDSLYLSLNDEMIEYNRTGEVEEDENPFSDPEYVDEVRREIDTLYQSGTDVTGRIHKMQAFILELALHAKQQNPDFQVICQNAAFLAYNDGLFEKGDQPFMKVLVDGWGVEGIVGKEDSLTPSIFQRFYVDQARKGKYVSDTTTVQSEEELENYLTRAKEWGIIPYPKVGGELAQELLPGQRWADNGDYFWVEDPSVLGTEDLFDGKRDVKKLEDAKNYLYNINSRPFDNWQDWDTEEAAFEKGSGDRTRITDSYACGLLVPSEGGQYTPVGDDEESTAEIIAEYGENWDWWWRAAGLDENAGRETWLETLRNSDYDVIYIDSFYNHKARPGNQTPLTAEEVESLKHKPDGGRRQVIAYLAIGTAEQNRWYCQDDWIWVDPKNKNASYSMKGAKIRERGPHTLYVPFADTASAIEAGDTAEPPAWIAFDYGDDYPEEAVVQWWSEDWRNIIINGGGRYTDKATGDNTSSVDRILAQGFDGVYLDNSDSCTDSYWEPFVEYWMENGGIPE